MINRLRTSFLATPYAVWILICTILPLFYILGYAITTSEGSFTLSNLTAIADPVHLSSLWLSIKVAFVTTVICLVLAYPVALILHNLKISNKGFVVFLFILPMWMNFMLRILAWQIILSNNGILNSILSAIGLPTVHILYTKAAVTLGMVYDFLPYMILPIYNALSKINDSVIEAAADLGANWWTTFTKITIPLSRDGILSGIIMVFVPALSSFVVSNLLGGGKVLLIGNVIEQEFTLARNWNLGSGLSIILMIFVLVSMSIMNRLDDSENGGMLV
ncbi:MAG: ABC transporter permease [Pseudobutyrivibrio sp.]|jgi:spermidine/putrescine transport system permease protein|uniref:ABC transporter permease n=1 Tax=Pseudobutyrivibrio ruminis TaxID=46206 RepID=A0A2G3EDX6_9FIRM|nr:MULTISPECIES: ABC transporter permease [Pseudobutyrivibrio]MBE5904389.1 ABC transporter permease [Pseudobutyrivibrio sp.]MBR5952233.1 ABC transporter permease [Pseudobutyrivibrio sp.]PHU35187.1 ABC transporter permease [Pseudobutyrivibrio ruminis]PHU41281.1 ABC transporter permease [Pseudobutyrivibrio ruminis]SCX75420.1 spermidine/putrescine transport system permease protein [Pseudobutyrivibrio sp. AR14]